jgi:hypothetical protein
VSDELEIMSSGGLVQVDGLLLRLNHRIWPVGLCKTEAPGKYIYIHHINRGFGSRDKNWGPYKYAQISRRTILYGSPELCGAVAWLVLVMVVILVRREVK